MTFRTAEERIAGSSRTAQSFALAALIASTLTLSSAGTSMVEAKDATASQDSSTSSEPIEGKLEVVKKGSKTGFSKDEKPVPVTARDNSINKSTAKAVSRIPGVKIAAKDLEPPAEQGEITGFHPIKKLFAPIIRLERNSVQLQQQIMKLEGPIAALNPPMMGLQKRMTSVESKMGNMQDKLDGMNATVTGVGNQMTGVRDDIQDMRKQISKLQEPIEALRPPIEKLQRPLVNVAEPLTEVHKELADMKTLLATVLAAILIATVAISIGTPIAAIIVYRNRKKIFPNMSDHELVPKDLQKDERRLTRVS